MPKKFGGYLLTKSQAGENDTVQEILGKLPALIKKKTILEVESIKWKSPGKVHQSKSHYSSLSGSDKTQRSLTVDSPKDQNSYKLVSFGELGKLWAPTLVLIKGDQYLILFERDESAAKDTVATPNVRKVAFKGVTSGDLTWNSSVPLDGKTLLFSEKIEVKASTRPAPILYGVNIICLINKDRQSSIQLEIHGKNSSKPDEVVLQHNLVLFDKHSQLTGPLKKEVIPLKEGKITAAGEDGTWTVTLEGQ